MHPQQILLATQELFSLIEESTQPASEQINAYTRTRRYIGSKDRKKLTENIWQLLRYKARLKYALPKASLEEKLAFLEEDKTNPQPLQSLLSEAPSWVQWEVPAWIIDLIPEAEQELPALLGLPKTILRATKNREKVAHLLAQEGLPTSPTPHSPFGLVLEKRTNLHNSPSYKTGLIEVQDEGSQLVGLATGIQAGDTVLDYCAGAGGKSLLFAQMMKNTGQIIAHDLSAHSLQELQKRAQRAGCPKMIQITRALPPKSRFSHVVVDAPCSGTGTWRRCPDARWKLSPEQLKSLVDKQAAILEKAQAFILAGGKLSYMTCSLLKPENEEQIRLFLDKHSDFTLLHEERVSPWRTGTDGLYVAVLQKKASNTHGTKGF